MSPDQRIALEKKLAFVKKYVNSHSENGYKNVLESKVKRKLVEPFLELMGWGNDENPDDLEPEAQLDGPKADLVCLVGEIIGGKLKGTAYFSLEVKRLAAGVRENRAVAQAVTYGNLVNARYSVVTNGRQWEVYKTHAEALPQDKFVCGINLLKCSVEEAVRFFSFFDRDRVIKAENFTIPKDASKIKPRRKRHRNRRVSLNDRHFRGLLDVLSQRFGELASMSENRNGFVSPDGETVRVCLAKGKDETALFNIKAPYLENGHILFAAANAPHAWLIPASVLKPYLLDEGDRDSWWPRVELGAEKEFMALRRNEPVPLDLSDFRQPLRRH